MSRSRVCWQLLRTRSVETNGTWLINARYVHWFKFITQACSCIYIRMYLLFWNYLLFVGSLGVCDIPVCAQLNCIPKKKESYAAESSPSWFPYRREMVSNGKLSVHMLLKSHFIRVLAKYLQKWFCLLVSLKKALMQILQKEARWWEKGQGWNLQ